MSAQLGLALVGDQRAPLDSRIDLRCCGCEAVDWPEADLVIADPPWVYRQKYGASAPPYPVLTTADIVRQLGGLRAPRMALWITWPLMPEWVEATSGAGRAWPWRWKTGGAWAKSDGRTGHYGPGHHWAGCSEPVMIYTRGLPRKGHNTHGKLRNTWTSHESNRGAVSGTKRHSAKPAEWMAAWLQRWVPEGGLVLDPYSGLGSVAEAVLLAGGGRRYLGTEIDPERHGQALDLLSRVEASP